MTAPVPTPPSAHDTFDTIRTVAAFGGFGLGIVNLGISLYRDFWRKGRLLVAVDSAVAKAVEQGLYDFQVILRLEATDGDVFLHSVTLRHTENVFGPYSARKNVALNKVYPYTARSLVDLPKEEFEKEVRGLNDKGSYVRDLQIKKDSQLTVTIVDRLESENVMGDWQEWPITGWSIDVMYRGRTVTVPFTWEIHPKSALGNFK